MVSSQAVFSNIKGFIETGVVWLSARTVGTGIGALTYRKIDGFSKTNAAGETTPTLEGDVYNLALGAIVFLIVWGVLFQPKKHDLIDPNNNNTDNTMSPTEKQAAAHRVLYAAAWGLLGGSLLAFYTAHLVEGSTKPRYGQDQTEVGYDLTDAGIASIATISFIMMLLAVTYRLVSDKFSPGDYADTYQSNNTPANKSTSEQISEGISWLVLASGASLAGKVIGRVTSEQINGFHKTNAEGEITSTLQGDVYGIALASALSLIIIGMQLNAISQRKDQNPQNPPAYMPFYLASWGLLAGTITAFYTSQYIDSFTKPHYSYDQTKVGFSLTDMGNVYIAVIGLCTMLLAYYYAANKAPRINDLVIVGTNDNSSSINSSSINSSSINSSSNNSSSNSDNSRNNNIFNKSVLNRLRY